MAQQLAGLASILQTVHMPPGVFPKVIDMPSPPKLEGPLAPNALLAKAHRYADKRLWGPESMVIYKGYIYTGQADGWIVRVNPGGAVTRLTNLTPRCSRRYRMSGLCGRPMGMRMDSQGYLIVADSANGIFKVNRTTGAYKQLVNIRGLYVNNSPVKYVNDVAVARDGTIFFTSSSAKWSWPHGRYILYEGDSSGRVLFYKPRETIPHKQVQELITTLTFPNGLELSTDESFLLVGEGSRSRILKVWVGEASPVRERIEVFASNLPGVVDNIRRSPRGTYWVALSQSRHHAMPSLLDLYGKTPRMRGGLMQMTSQGFKLPSPKLGIVVELNESGDVIRSLQDPQGTLYSGVSEAQEVHGALLLTSTSKMFIGFIKLPAPPPVPSTTAPTVSTTASPQANTANPGSTTGGKTPIHKHPRVLAFLNKVREHVMKMTMERVRRVVLHLAKQVILAKQRAVYLQKLADQKEADVRRVQEMLKVMEGRFTTQAAADSSVSGGTETSTLPGAGSTGPTGVPGEGSTGTTSGSDSGSMTTDGSQAASTTPVTTAGVTGTSTADVSAASTTQTSAGESTSQGVTAGSTAATTEVSATETSTVAPESTSSIAETTDTTAADTSTAVESSTATDSSTASTDSTATETTADSTATETTADSTATEGTTDGTTATEGTTDGTTATEGTTDSTAATEGTTDGTTATESTTDSTATGSTTDTSATDSTADSTATEGTTDSTATESTASTATETTTNDDTMIP